VALGDRQSRSLGQPYNMRLKLMIERDCAAASLTCYLVDEVLECRLIIGAVFLVRDCQRAGAAV